eukprot:TRINITY_DN2960_c0_g4_i1.p1 TRINITY_DN2960_c0_g4~~TRINITY_DN2960_c0_g4_i1.p1  ORF type:complete len:202 (+),score=34.34 TRINITY_DN2960_c0_g4_i1:212-817(+)
MMMMKTMKTTGLLCCLLVVVMMMMMMGVSSMRATPPALPDFTTGSFNGTVYLEGMTLPYHLYNDVDRELHIDFAGTIMMGAYVNGTAYLNNPPPVGCLAYPNSPFPFPPDLFQRNNATFIGYEIILDDKNVLVEVDHWSLAFPAMGEMQYMDVYFKTDTLDLMQAVFIGANSDHSSVIIRLNGWDYSPPPTSAFDVPPYCH